MSWRWEVVDEIGSTSDALIERAIAGETDRTALLARRQSKGRGRRGRRWEGPVGNLALSVLLRPRWRSGEVGQAVFVAGLAMGEALQGSVTDGRRLMLKWPNDVLLDGDKLGGILVESALDETGLLDWLVIGFGANLARAPELADRRAACLAECAEPLPAAEAVGRAVVERLDHWFARLERDGFGAVRAAWMERAHAAGTPVVVSGCHGRFAGLSEAGHLLLDVGDGVEVFSAGDVVLADA